MTDTTLASPGIADRSRPRGPAFAARLQRRYVAERRFRRLGMAAIGFAIAMLVLLLGSILWQGLPAFRQTQLLLDISFDPAVLDPTGTRQPAVLAAADYTALVRTALSARLPAITERNDRRKLMELVSKSAAFDVRDKVVTDPSLIGRTASIWVLASDEVDQFVKRGDTGRLLGKQLDWVRELREMETVRIVFNTTLFTASDSREPEQAGLWGSLVGSFLTLLVTLLLAVPAGTAAAVYLEEFARKNRFTDLIEVNINNLAAVPSIIFGLLGLAVFLGTFGLPRSAPLVGGLVLALMTLPTIIIAARSALKAVPPSIREAALGLGASPVQMVLHHVLPLAMPGILTGTIIGMARALGETAPLLMIGMVAFIADIPGGITDSATVLPVQIYMWADSPERAFTERTSAAILLLLGVLVLMNGAAVLLRKTFERRW